MESFEDIQQQEETHLLGEIGALGRHLVELGWSQEQVLAYVKKVFNESMDHASGARNSDGKES